MFLTYDYIFSDDVVKQACPVCRVGEAQEIVGWSVAGGIPFRCVLLCTDGLSSREIGNTAQPVGNAM